MNRQQRIHCIKEIADKLAEENWTYIDLVLHQYGLPTNETWNGSSADSYIIAMIKDADNETLSELSKQLNTTAAKALHTRESSDQTENETKIFLSHLASSKKKIAKIKEELRWLGMTAFVAHKDIKPTKEWQDEIENALSEMDGFVAIIEPGFKESDWCDQEIGCAIGRKIPIVVIRSGLDPYGFIGKYQAIQGLSKTERSLAKEVYAAFMQHEAIGRKITSALVHQLSESPSYQTSITTADLLYESPYTTENQISSLIQAAKTNSQISSAFGVVELINKMAKEG